MSVEKLKGWFGWPDLVAETHGTRPRAILDLNDGVLLKIVGDGVDQKETGEARRAIDDEDGNSRCHMRPGVGGPRSRLQAGERQRARGAMVRTADPATEIASGGFSRRAPPRSIRGNRVKAASPSSGCAGTSRCTDGAKMAGIVNGD